jgi:hypothetical protein
MRPRFSYDTDGGFVVPGGGIPGDGRTHYGHSNGSCGLILVVASIAVGKRERLRDCFQQGSLVDWFEQSRDRMRLFD